MSETQAEAAAFTDVLEPPAPHRIVVIGKDDLEMRFVQKPLSFFGKMEFFSVMGTAIDKVLSGPDGIDISDLLGSPERGDTLTSDDLRDAEVFLRAIGKLVVHVPELLGDLYCVILAVPKGQRNTVKYLMSLPEDEGGLSDENGIGVLETFVDQNWDVLVDFFGKHVKPLVDRVSQKMKGRESVPSKPSKATQRRTPKQ